MFDALFVGATGMRGQQLQIDTIAHNMANLNTVGFRRGIASFSEVSAALAATSLGEAALGQSTTPMLRGAGTVSSVNLSMVAGELRQTNEPLDVAVDGIGFIEVIRADGTPAYTRAGHLRMNEDGLLAAADGSPLAARIELPTDSRTIRILEDGRVTAQSTQDEAPVEVGQIELVAFPNPGALSAAGNNLYVASANAGEPQIAAPGELGMGLLRQGYVESSNVNMGDEMVTLMLAQRAFELNARVVQAADQMLSITNGLYR
jgi:flagellar basal-body rod protein FlgG